MPWQSYPVLSLRRDAEMDTVNVMSLTTYYYAKRVCDGVSEAIGKLVRTFDDRGIIQKGGMTFFPCPGANGVEWIPYIRVPSTEIADRIFMDREFELRGGEYGLLH